MTAPLILIVDDEPQIQRFLSHALKAAGYQVAQADCGKAGLEAATALNPALLLLDLGLPDIDGKLVIERLRKTSALPIIVLSAQDQEMERIMALDLGANDFIGKPFGIGELLARIRACLRLRPASDPAPTRLMLADLTIDLAAHQVSRAGQPIRLTPTEFDLLTALAARAGTVLTHRQLLAEVWGPAHVEDVPYLRVFIAQLRQKIEPDPSQPALILTEPGIGYRAAPDGD